MKISYNFLSVVAIGNFNPAIVSPDFLIKVCSLDLGEAKELTPANMPILKVLRFGDIELIVDLERLNIKENNIKDIHNTKIIEIFRAYSEKLPYTPIMAVGININCELITEIGSKESLILERIQSPDNYLDFFGASEIDVTEKVLCRKDGKVWSNSNIRIENLKSLIRNINIKKQSENSFIINYNNEAGNLSQDASRLKFLLNSYEEFCEEFLKFIDYLER